ncbi:MAG TPA: hypothetical protein VLA48_06030 [Nitrososphaeraceae archaeon]|nr:hypothetical protein [Nitrososphaeraceae archaeon]
MNLSETFSHAKKQITYHRRQTREEGEEGKEIESPPPFIYSVYLLLSKQVKL